MVFRVLVLGLLISGFLQTSTATADPKYWWFQSRQLELAPEPSMSVPFRNFFALSETTTVSQRLDHDSATDGRTYEQRFWRNSAFALGDDAPVIIFICGEGACSSRHLGGATAEHARKLGAHLFALEHRYYGESQPFGDLSTENLKYLSTDAALKDLVAFRKYAIEKYKVSAKWIAVGGSYPGSLAAYARALYPNEFVGALASSAPVRADLDFSEYDLHVSRVTGADCLEAVQKVVGDVERAIESDEGFASAKERFAASPLEERDDFLYLLADVGAMAVQYGMRERFCALVTEKGEEGYAEATLTVSNIFGNLVNFSPVVAVNPDLSLHGGGIGIRQWYYQSCTEYGYWQNATANPAESARSARINPAYHERLCDRLFGIKTPALVDETNAKFYVPILRPETTRIFFTNGSEDPWMNLSLTEKSHAGIETMVIPGAAHCDDLGGSGDEAVRAAKAEFDRLAADWVQ